MQRIVDLQRRLREVGRIRIGEQVPTSNGRTRPGKLANFRLTSRDRQVIDAAAEIYGGKVEAWTAPDGQQWEVKTTSDQMPVILPPGDMAFSQAYEVWSAGGCKVRCDGAHDYVNDRDCHCDPDKRECKIHTRLSVILPDLPGLGVWRLDTQGYYAAVELGGVVDVCVAYARAGQMLPARLRLEQRSVKRPDGKGGVETRRYAVPVLDVDVHPMALTGGVDRATGEIGGGPLPALGAGPSFTPVPVDELPAGPQPSVAEQVTAVNDPAPRKARANAQAPIPSTGLKPRTAAQAGQSTPAASAPAPAASNGGPVCGACGLSLAGCAVKIEGGVRMHKDGCPTGSAPDGPGAAHDERGPEHETMGLEREPTDEVVYRDVDIHQLAAETFARAKDEARRGQKSKIVDRCRHVLTYAITEGRTSSLKDLSAREKHRLWMELTWIKDGHRTYEVTADALIVTKDGRETVLPFADAESEAA